MPGFAGRAYAPKVIDMSARWLGVMAAEYGIPLVKLSVADLRNPNARGVCGHADIPNPDNPLVGGGKDQHTDPGPTYPWATVLAQAARVAGVTPGDPAPPTGSPVFFPLTGFYVRGWFARHYQARGGVAQFGYPLSREFVETLSDGKPHLVQYFERARLELHGEPPTEVIGGQLGREVIALDAKRGRFPNAFVPEEGK
jgi:hypothetical protein